MHSPPTYPGRLPHFDAPGASQFITLRLADSMPAALRAEWAAFETLTDERTRLTSIQNYLDRGRGACQLGIPHVAELVGQALRNKHREQYVLKDWVIMPNHVHFLMETIEGWPLPRVMQSFKSYTTRLANQTLGTTGRFWFPDYFDRFIRDADHELRVKYYIQQNPVKAGLVAEAKEWRHWSGLGEEETGS